jgi:NAD(P)H-flavin reductase
MLAGGTGVTPMYSILQASSLAKDNVHLHLFVSNQTKNDIILKSEIDGFITLNKNLKVHYTLTRHNDNFHGKRAGIKGRISKRMLQEAGFPMKPKDDTIMLICGPNNFEMAMV